MREVSRSPVHSTHSRVIRVKTRKSDVVRAEGSGLYDTYDAAGKPTPKYLPLVPS